MVKLKICGITRLEDLEYIDSRKLADYIGIIVDPNIESPRKVSRGLAKILLENVKYAKPVAVISSLEGIDIAHELEFPIIQYHTTHMLEKAVETADMYNMKIAPVVVYRGNEEECIRAVEYIVEKYYDKCEYILLDSDKKLNIKLEFNLKIPLKLVSKICRICDKAGIAGGIDIDNVEFILRYRPYLIDVSSSVEEYPGVKSGIKIEKLASKVRKL